MRERRMSAAQHPMRRAIIQVCRDLMIDDNTSLRDET
jgi:hypothetical protein